MEAVQRMRPPPLIVTWSKSPKREQARSNNQQSSPSKLNMKTILSFVCGVAAILGFQSLASNPSHHVYELRMYHVNPGKMDALSARFGDHTDAIFKRHNMKSLGYWVPEDALHSQNLFIYILEHPSREEAEKNWAAFHEDPEWKKVKAESEKNGALVDHIDNYLMDPTNYSALN